MRSQSVSVLWLRLGIESHWILSTRVTRYTEEQAFKAREYTRMPNVATKIVDKRFKQFTLELSSIKYWDYDAVYLTRIYPEFIAVYEPTKINRHPNSRASCRK
jgi:hypothetical protein